MMNRQMLHDPDSYANPLEFNPGRFLGDHPEPDPRGTAFGHGRRVCECFCFIVILDSLGRVIETLPFPAPSVSPNDRNN